MEPEYTEVIKLLIRHEPNGSYPVAIDEKGDEYLLTTFIDGDQIHPGAYETLTTTAHRIAD